MVATTEPELLTVDTVAGHLRQRGLFAAGDPVAAVALAGGVSNVVLSARSPSDVWVVKQSLGRLDVPGEWWATRERTLVEAAALEICRAATPQAVPRVVDLDTDDLVLVIESAPDGWATLKDLLMDGHVPTWAFSQLGELLATWHTSTQGRAQVLEGCDDALSFRQLRTDPFHRRVAQVHPDLADVVIECLDELEGQRTCLVHGDFSPKNILVGPEQLWVIDFEVAHIGSPVFDLAFLVTHLALKAAHRPASLPAYAQATQVFLASYEGQVSADVKVPESTLLSHVGCLLLARVDGLSRAPYLTSGSQAVVRETGRALLGGACADVTELFTSIAQRQHG